MTRPLRFPIRLVATLRGLHPYQIEATRWDGWFVGRDWDVMTLIPDPPGGAVQVCAAVQDALDHESPGAWSVELAGPYR